MITKRNWIFSENKSNALLILKIKLFSWLFSKELITNLNVNKPFLSTPMRDHRGFSRSMFLECAADGVVL